MKVLIVFCALLVAVYADHHEHHHEHSEYVVKTHDDLLKFRDHCVTKLNVPVELVEKYKLWQYPDDETTHCYMKCIFEQFGFFDEHKGFDVRMVHHQLEGSTADHTDETHQKIERCADNNAVGSDVCTWAYRGGMCFIKEHLQLVQHSVKKN